MIYDSNMEAMNSPDFQAATEAAVKLRAFMAKHDVRSIYGMGDVVELARQLDDLQRQLDEATRERDHFRAMCELADQLRNRERGL